MGAGINGIKTALSALILLASVHSSHQLGTRRVHDAEEALEAVLQVRASERRAPAGPRSLVPVVAETLPAEVHRRLGQQSSHGSGSDDKSSSAARQGGSSQGDDKVDEDDDDESYSEQIRTVVHIKARIVEDGSANRTAVAAGGNTASQGGYNSTNSTDATVADGSDGGGGGAVDGPIPGDALLDVVSAVLNTTAAAADLVAAKARVFSLAAADALPNSMRMDYTYNAITSPEDSGGSNGGGAAAAAGDADDNPSSPDGSAASGSSGSAAPAAASAAVALQAANVTMTPAVALAAKRAQEADGMASWVVCGWQLGNITNPDDVSRSWDRELVRSLITNSTSLSPEQVEVVATANVTLAVRFGGAALSEAPAVTARALRTAFAELALGFDPELIRVSFDPELLLDGYPAQQQQQQAPRSQGPTGFPSSAGAGVGEGVDTPRQFGSRKLLLLPPGATRGTPGGGSSGAPGPAASAPAGAAARRRLLAGPSGSWGDAAVLASYTGLSPSSVRLLSQALSLSCGSLESGLALPDNCTSVFARLLNASGVPVDPSSFSAAVLRGAAVTVNVLVAAGLTRQQTEAGMGPQVADWLADGGNFKAMMDSVGPAMSGAEAHWLQEPQIIYAALKSAADARKANKRLAIGLAVPLGVCVLGLAAVLGVLLLRRWRRRALAGAPVEGGGAAGAGGGALKSKHPKPDAGQPRGKRRYLAPPQLPGSDADRHRIEELAAANLRAAGSSGAGASTSTAGTALPAALAAAGAPIPGGSYDEDDDGADGASLSPAPSEAEQRPRLRSLGDSVTSAVRFELEVHEGEDGGSESADPSAPGDEAPSPTLAGQEWRDGAAPALLLARVRQPSSSRASDPWPGPVEAAPVVSGPLVVMGAASPPRVGALRSPFGQYNFSAVAAGDASGAPPASSGGGGLGPFGTGSAAAAAGFAGPGPFGGSAAGANGGAMVTIGPDGSVVVLGMDESLALASASGSGSAGYGSGQIERRDGGGSSGAGR